MLPDSQIRRAQQGIVDAESVRVAKCFWQRQLAMSGPLLKAAEEQLAVSLRSPAAYRMALCPDTETRNIIVLQLFLETRCSCFVLCFATNYNTHNRICGTGEVLAEYEHTGNKFKHIHYLNSLEDSQTSKLPETMGCMKQGSSGQIRIDSGRSIHGAT